MINLIKHLLSAGLFLIIAFSLNSCNGQTAKNEANPTTKKATTITLNNDTMNNKMKVEIWSDIACPFCYIGKRNFETALNQFENKDKIQVVWRSFQLVPDAKFIQGQDEHTALAKHHHTSVEQAKAMNAQVSNMAKSFGLTYNMDIAVWANTFDAHRIIHYAQSKGLAEQAEERLFKAHFTNGENIEDHTTLIRIAKEIGLDENETKQILAGTQYTNEVRQDIAEASRLGLRGVPSYVLDRKTSFSGAVPANEILKVLENNFSVWQRENLTKANVQGNVCTPEGKCE